MATPTYSFSVTKYFLTMKNQPLVSVIVPCYNVEQYLPKCIESIINQTYENLEVWLVDDGSLDRCREICDEYAAKDKRIKVIHKQNGGLADARNVALDVMAGEYVVCVDSDDYISPTHIEGLYNLIEKYDAQVSVNSSCSFFEGTTPFPTIKSGVDTVFDTGLKAVEAMFYQEQFDTNAWGKMYKANLFYGVRYPKGLLFEDLPTTYKLLLKSDKVVFNNEQSYFYLLRKNSIEGAAFSPRKLDSGLKLIALMDQDQDKLQPIIKSYNCRVVSFIFHLLLQMPMEHEQRKSLETIICKKRWLILTDVKARKKTRLACLLSYFSFDLVQKLFNKIKIR